jgi:hypothetical protein
MRSEYSVPQHHVVIIMLLWQQVLIKQALSKRINSLKILDISYVLDGNLILLFVFPP